jgi:hypothetical protein
MMTVRLSTEAGTLCSVRFCASGSRKKTFPARNLPTTIGEDASQMPTLGYRGENSKSRHSLDRINQCSLTEKNPSLSIIPYRSESLQIQ